jgi:hypothetical protein
MNARWSTPPGEPAAFHTTGQRRTNFDDARRLSDWHYDQGKGLAATDLDLLMCESKFETPVALIEYKRMSPRPLEITNALRQFQQLADMCGLPAYVVFYDYEPWFFTVRTWNIEAYERDGADDRAMTERQFVAWLHKIRGLPMPDCWPNCAAS